MLEPLSYIHVTRATPAPAVAMQGILAFIFLTVGDINALIEFASFLIWFFYGCAMVALLVMRKTHANVHRPYKVPLILPIITLLVSIFLVITPIVSKPDIKYLSAIGFILVGVAVYIPFVYFKQRPRFMGKSLKEPPNQLISNDHSFLSDKVTHLIQMFFMVAPTNELKES